MTTLQDILEATAQHFGVEPNLIRFRARRKTICDARSVFCLLARKMTRHGLREIREFLGGRHHSVVIVAAQRAEEIADLRKAALAIARDLKYGAMPCKCPRCGCVIRRSVA